jgi:hypothetical protein
MLIKYIFYWENVIYTRCSLTSDNLCNGTIAQQEFLICCSVRLAPGLTGERIVSDSPLYSGNRKNPPVLRDELAVLPATLCHLEELPLLFENG